MLHVLVNFGSFSEFFFPKIQNKTTVNGTSLAKMSSIKQNLILTLIFIHTHIFMVVDSISFDYHVVNTNEVYLTYCSSVIQYLPNDLKRLSICRSLVPFSSRTEADVDNNKFKTVFV